MAVDHIVKEDQDLTIFRGDLYKMDYLEYLIQELPEKWGRILSE